MPLAARSDCCASSGRHLIWFRRKLPCARDFTHCFPSTTPDSSLACCCTTLRNAIDSTLLPTRHTSTLNPPSALCLSAVMYPRIPRDLLQLLCRLLARVLPCPFLAPLPHQPATPITWLRTYLPLPAWQRLGWRRARAERSFPMIQSTRVNSRGEGGGGREGTEGRSN